MKKIWTILGIAGLVVLLSGSLVYLFQNPLRSYAPYLGLAGLALLLVYFLGNFGQIKRFFAKRSTKLGANTALMILLLLAIISLVEIISYRNNKRYDLTQNQRFTLSPQSKKILQGLKKAIQLTAFYRPGEPNRENLEDLLRQYSLVSTRLKYEFVDPDRNPVKTRRYGVTTYGTTVVESQGKEEKVYTAEEEEITNAVLKVSREGKKTIYFLTGHGEPGINDSGKNGYSNAKKAIESENYEVKELLLLREEKVPADTAVLIIDGPKKDLLNDELTKLEKYISGGGKILCMLDPFSAPSLSTLMAKYGVAVGNNIIIDRMSRIFGADYTMPVVSSYDSHDITKDLNAASFFPLACSVESVPAPDKGIEAQSLARTSRDSWAETNKEMLDTGKASFEEGKDKPGPISVAVVISIDTEKAKTNQKSANNKSETLTKEDEEKEEETEKNKGPKARLVVYGDSDFANNAYIHISGNSDLFLNTVSWLAEEEDLISIRPKTPQSSPVILTATQANLIFWVPVVFLPATVLVVGISVFYQRRRLS